MNGLKWLVLLLVFFPVMPDLSCVPVYASDGTASESVDGYLRTILFFLCVLLGCRLWKVFINSFEKGSF